MTKLVDFLELKQRISNKKNKKFVITCGFFDFIKPWHIDLFDFAKDQDNILLVIIFKNESQIPVEEKIEILSAIDVIDIIFVAKEDEVVDLFSGLDGIDFFVFNRETDTNIRVKLSNINTKRFKE